MLDMPGWEGYQLIVKSRIELGFTECPSQSRQNQAFYNKLDAGIDAKSATAVKENAVIVKFSYRLLAAPILFLLPSRSLHIFISPFSSARRTCPSSVPSSLDCEGHPSEHNIIIP